MNFKADDLLIIGYGNSLRGDDDAGPAVARELRRRGFAAIETHQLTPELAETLSIASLALFVDANAIREPGRIWVGAVPEADQPVFEHHPSPAVLLRLAREVYGRAPEALLVAIGAASYEIGAGLSRPVQHAIRRTVGAISCFARHETGKTKRQPAQSAGG
ncbi:MAG TPA: hydrogenase maturation protease [Bryobacteraceae bacterium]|nr:hydrogenase maturation protease [Bryobacteraceae bacterium]